MTIEIAVKQILIALLFFSFYRIALANTTFLALRRYTLLLTGFLTCLPLIWLNQNGDLIPVLLPEIQVPLGIRNPLSVPLNLKIIGSLYRFGLVLGMAVFAVKVVRLVGLFRKSKPSTIPFERIIAKDESPCSFLVWRFIPEGLNTSLLIQVRAHEKAHVQLFHSLDIIALELLQIFFFYNPILYYIRRELVLVHEYQADERVSKTIPEYRTGLLDFGRWRMTLSLTSNINPMFINLKNRIQMLQKAPTSPARKALFLFIIPLLVGAIGITACQQESVVVEMNQVDKMPEFQDGQAGLINYISTNLKYPSEEKAQQIEGKIIVEFIVDENGKAMDPKVVSGENEHFKQAALAVFDQMPNWTPGEKDGKAVRTKFYLPFNFALN